MAYRWRHRVPNMADWQTRLSESDEDEELHPPILTSLPQTMEQDSDLSNLDQAHQHMQQISSRGWFAVFIDTYCQAQMASISWDFSAPGATVKSLTWSFSSNLGTGKLPRSSYVAGPLCPGDELFAIGPVVVHEQSRDIIETTWAEVMVRTHNSFGIVELVFLRGRR